MTKYLVLGNTESPKLGPKILTSIVEGKAGQAATPAASHFMRTAEKALKDSGLKVGRTRYAKSASRDLTKLFTDNWSQVLGPPGLVKVKHGFKLSGKYNFGLLVEASKPTEVKHALDVLPGVTKVEILPTSALEIHPRSGKRKATTRRRKK